MMLFLLALLPEIFLCFFVYSLDHHKEPLLLLFELFLGGIFTCLLVGLFNLYFDPIQYFNQDKILLKLFYNFLYVAFIEEILKWIGTYFIGYKSKEFNENYDIILYACMISLGFALFENIFYSLNGGYVVAILRSIFAVPAHLCYGTFMGYFLLLYKKENQKKYLILSIICPMILHGFYDFCLINNSIIVLFCFITFMISMLMYATYVLFEISKT